MKSSLKPCGKWLKCATFHLLKSLLGWGEEEGGRGGGGEGGRGGREGRWRLVGMPSDFLVPNKLCLVVLNLSFLV